ncbi:CKLF-like MARVEL transmembrane domain-containing protein 3 [Scomber scombrus]|uniref:CKLF-like MARVEL transmembrane domain-containing protein 3 n=1 Tax=Scomber scombrus TaxID=13677 RepID=A0AAV1PPR9_SCOSC
MLKVTAGVKIAHILTNSHFLYSLKEITCFRKQTLSCLLQMISYPRAEDQNITTTAMDVDTAFLKSKRGILKLAEMVTFFVAFVCFATASRSEHIAATIIEFLITSFLVLLYLLKLNKKFTFFLWPLVDTFNSVFAAIYFIVLSMIALRTYTYRGTLVGGVRNIYCSTV